MVPSETAIIDDAPPSPPAPARQRHRSRRRRVLLAVVAVLAVAMAIGVALYRRQITSYVTHWKGSPKGTVVYEPHDPPPDLRIAATGDIGDSGGRLDATAAAIDRMGRDDPYDALLLLGDNVYPNGAPERLDETVFGPFGPVLDSGTELLAILGNHDVKQGHADEHMERLGMPGRYWARTLGDVLVVGLDSNMVEDPDQLAFLERTLADSDARWKIVAVHHPPYSAGYQGSDGDVRRILSPVFEEYGVDLVLSGHDHDYQRSEPIDGVTYVVSGAGAGTRRTGEKSFTEVSFSWHHFLDLAVFPDRLVLRAVNQDERVADELVLRQDGSAR